MKKAFIITIDTEGDNLWRWSYGDEITSNNARYIKRFQQTCERYGFKPVYLTNYEMATSEDFVSVAKEALNRGQCEIGMHLHAVNNPPLVDLPVKYSNNFPYLIEYDAETMEQKISYLKRLIEDTFEIKVFSHRSGRWALDDRYIRLLAEQEILVDCSVTPGICWKTTGGLTEGSIGSDYSKSDIKPFRLCEGLIEVPMTIRHYNKSFIRHPQSIKDHIRIIKHTLRGQNIWLRPDGRNQTEIDYLLNNERNSESDYLMFMLHSSELMPGGSPTFPDDQSIEILYDQLETIFRTASSFCVGKTLKEYYDGVRLP